MNRVREEEDTSTVCLKALLSRAKLVVELSGVVRTNAVALRLDEELLGSVQGSLTRRSAGRSADASK